MTSNGSHWRSPPAIEAPSPNDKSKTVRFGVSDDLTGRGRDNWRRTPLYMLWAHLLGQLPPVNNAAYALRGKLQPTFTTLHDAKACFSGLKRPHHEEDDGCSVLIYSLKPAATLFYSLEHAMVCPMGVRLIPPAAVVTVQVRLAASLQEPIDGLDGLVTRIEPVAGEPPAFALPVGHADRYASRCW